MKKYNTEVSSKTAFTLIELAVVMVVIGLIFGSFLGGASIIESSRVSTARALTQSSIVKGINGLVFWVESTSEESFLEIQPDDNSPATQWNDLGDQNIVKNNFSEATNPPTYIKDGIRGLPSLRFDGANDRLVAPHSSSLAVIGDITLFAVISADTFAGAARPILSKAVGSSPNPYDFYVNGGGSGLIRGVFGRPANFDSTSSVSQISIQTPVLVNMIVRGDSVLHYFNGTLVNNDVDALTTDISEDGGASAMIGARPDTKYFDGDIGEIILYNRAIKDSERKGITDYLVKKWRLN